MSCNDKNSLLREGTSLFNRVLAALDTGFARIDERREADLILFAKHYAAYLNYYNESNMPAGDWQILMKMDACVGLAELLKINSKKNYDYKLLLYKQIKLASLELTDADAKTKKQFKFLFDFIFSLAKFIDEQYTLIPDELSKKDVLKGVISNKMSEALANLVKLFDKFSSPGSGLIDTTVTELDEINAPVALTSCTDFDDALLNAEWTPVPALSYSIIDSITVPAKTATFTEKDQVVWIINHNLFNAQIDNLFKGIAFLSMQAAEIFNQVVADYPKHDPHYALFLSFIKLFKIAQDDLNRYTQRHLDFYYKDILQLKNKLPVSDQVHVTFELQKAVNNHLLTKGALFKAGKDITGKEIKYSLTSDLVLSKASIEKMHSWQLAGDEKPVLQSFLIANSDNGVDPKISSPDKSWFTFGDVAAAKKAESGFGIASNILFLKEGTRKVDLLVNFKYDIAGYSGFTTDCFKAKITGDKGWHDVEGLDVKFNSASVLSFSFTLEGDDPPVIPYSEKIHQSKLEIDLPLLKVYLDQESASGIPYTLICNKVLSSVVVSVDVTGVRDLELSNDNGSVDPSKPFKPFGDFPGNDASFYIGSNEVFQKSLSSLGFDFKWKKPSPSLNSKAVFLKGNKWDDKYDIASNSISFQSKPFNKTRINFEENEPLEVKTIEGFLRLRLVNSIFSYDIYLGKVKDQVNKTTFQKSTASNAYHLTVAAMPSQDEAVLESFALNYVASTTIGFTDADPKNNDLLYHFTPFGYAKVRPDHVTSSSNAEAIEHITMVPDIIHKGELFIGIGNTGPGSVINILFQVADGSSNPLRDMETVNWYFLSGHNNWKKFSGQDIVDGTNNFTQSGIVTVSLPANISAENTSFEKGLCWIKAVVENNADAVCKMVLVQAQAGLVQLVQDESREIEFRQTLPANTISKLATGDSAIKTITQPSDSFGGRIREKNEDFYVRVSERLRHKQRAINIWDYEHIILEEFQSIFKVKCLNHSGFYMEADQEVFCENFPGHVTIITIPSQKNKTNINPLRPYTSIRLLTTIDGYLKKLNSPFVKLHVKNPQFEEVQLDFKVKFHENMDEAFYLQLLNGEIERFLCPWAFDEGKEIVFGGKIVKSVLLNFVEERPYVDFVTCFTMNHIIKRKGSIHEVEKQNVEEAVGSTSRSLLVSYFNEETNLKHKIVAIAECDCQV